MKKMTQTELAEKLGVSDRTVGNWENGRNMPDLALLNPLCDVLNITLNELLNGELSESKTDEKLEKTLEISFDYSQNIIDKKDKYLGFLMLIFGIALDIFSGIFYYTRNHGRAYIYLIGIYFAAVGLNKILKSAKNSHHVFISIVFAVLIVGSSFAYDYYKVSHHLDTPMWAYQTDGLYDDILQYKTPFYNYYIVHYNQNYDYYGVFDGKKEYTPWSLKTVPFTSESSISELKKCNGDIECIVNKMPLYFKYDLDDANKKIVFYYEENSAQPRYLNDIKKALLYASLVIFLFTDYDELEYQVTYNHDIDDPKYLTKREQFTTDFPKYDTLVSDLTEENFHNLFETQLNIEYTKYYFKLLFTTDTIFDPNSFQCDTQCGG